jgi:hypothetical protein
LTEAGIFPLPAHVCLASEGLKKFGRNFLPANLFLSVYFFEAVKTCVDLFLEPNA